MRHPLIWAAAAVAGGIMIAEALTGASLFWALWIALALGLAAVAARRARAVVLATLPVWVGLGGLASSLRTLPAVVPTICGTEAGQVRGRIVAAVATQARERGTIQRTEMEIEAARCAAAWAPINARVEVALRGGPAVRRGDLIAVRVRLTSIERAHNPVGPDPVQHARDGGLTARAQVLSPHVLVEAGHGLTSAIDGAREPVARLFETTYATNRAGLAKALALGDQDDIPATQREAWADAGLAHVLAVSGLQVSCVALLAFWCARLALSRLPGAGEKYSLRRIAAACALLAVALYCLWVGAGPPVARAGLMAGAGLTALLLGRSAGTALNAWALAALSLLLLDPIALFDVSFLLSFAAVGALVMGPPVARGWRGWLWRVVLATVLATVATAPIAAHAFGRVSLIAPFTNLVAVAIANGLATPLALAVSVTAVAAPDVAAVLVKPYGWALGGLDAIAMWASALPAAVDMRRPHAVEWLAYVAILLSILLWPRRRRWLACGVLGLAALLTTWASGRRADGELRIVHPYVGQGGAAIVLLPEGGTLLFDAGGAIEPGGWDPGRGVVAPLLRMFGVRNLDVAVVSHPHPDHLQGMAYISEHFPIGELWWNGAGAELATMQSVTAAVQRRGGHVIVATTLPVVQTREGVRLRVLHPRGPDGGVYPELSTNDNSIVLELTYRGRRVLLGGDIEAAAEEVVAPLVENASVMRVPHHGSRTSSSPALLERVQPSVAIVSCGERNIFGFPHHDVVQRYGSIGATLLRTDHDGLISQVTSSAGWLIDTHRTQRHFAVP